jgi:1-acyl-sn-glycerol-3-phosphate acyltransferase
MKDLKQLFNKVKDSHVFNDIKFLTYSPELPNQIEPKEIPQKIGVNFQTSWARKRSVVLARSFILDFLITPTLTLVAAPIVKGDEVLKEITPPVIFISNHSSHLDTPLILSCLTPEIRKNIVVAAAADYFFSNKVKAFSFAFLLNAIPMERTKINRASAEVPFELIKQGWNLLIFPEGGRSPDGWMGSFKGGAAYLAHKAQVKVVPIHISGARKILKKGAKRLVTGTTELRFGSPIEPSSDIRHFNQELQNAVAALADEASSNYYKALLNAKAGQTPDPTGPKVSPWRRSWTLPDWASSSKQEAKSHPWPKI